MVTVNQLAQMVALAGLPESAAAIAAGTADLERIAGRVRYLGSISEAPIVASALDALADDLILHHRRRSQFAAL